MDVNFADTHDLFPATVAVEVVFTKNDTPRPSAAIFKKKRSNMILSGIKD